MTLRMIPFGALGGEIVQIVRTNSVDPIVACAEKLP